jgi:outer membrane protein assembly factor BamB
MDMPTRSPRLALLLRTLALTILSAQGCSSEQQPVRSDGQPSEPLADARNDAYASANEPQWAQSGSSARRDGQGAYDGPSSPRKLLWKYALGGARGSEIVVGSDGTAYFAQNREGHRGSLIALDRDGNVRWRMEADEYLSSPALGQDGKIHVVAAEAGAAALIAYDPDGRQSWRHGLTGALTTELTISDTGEIYFGTGSDGDWRARVSRLHAVSQLGSEIWAVTLTSAGYLSTPAISGDTIFVGGDRLRAVRRKDGALSWERPIQTVAGAYGPAVGPDGTLYVATTNWQFDTAQSLVALDPEGTPKWKVDTGYLELTPAVAADGTVYFHAWPSSEADLLSSGLFALRPDGSVKWALEDFMLADSADPDISSPLSGSDSSPTIGADGTIYVGADTGSLYAISSDGRLQWEAVLGFELDNRPALGADGTLYICNAGSPGHTKCFALSDRGELALPVDPWDGFEEADED